MNARNIFPIQLQQVNYTLNGPLIVEQRKVQPKIAEEIIRDYFNNQASITQTRKVIENNLDILKKVIAQTININNICQMVTKVKYLDAEQCLIEIIQNSQNLQIFGEKLLDDGQTQILNKTKFDYDAYLNKHPNKVNYVVNLKNVPIIQVQKFINLKTQIKPEFIVSILDQCNFSEEETYHLFDQCINPLIIKKQFLDIELIQKQAKQIERDEFVMIISDVMKKHFTNQCFIYDIFHLFLQDQKQKMFLEKEIIPKIYTNNYFQQIVIQHTADLFIQGQQINANQYFESLNSKDIQGEFIILSNYYWNKGQLIMNDGLRKIIESQKEFKYIIDKFNSLKKQKMQQLTLQNVIFTIQIQQYQLQVDINELLILRQFNKTNQIPSKGVNGAERLIKEGILSQNKENLLFGVLKNLNYTFLQQPEQQKEIIEQISPQERLIIIEAGLAKIIKQNKQIQLSQLVIKLQQMTKRILQIVNEGEINDSLSNLVKKDIILRENDQLYYNI
ncbi:hypothetical protein pb186bvf_011952 [Paramecium bursaria]